VVWALGIDTITQHHAISIPSAIRGDKQATFAVVAGVIIDTVVTHEVVSNCTVGLPVAIRTECLLIKIKFSPSYTGIAAIFSMNISSSISSPKALINHLPSQQKGPSGTTFVLS